MIAPAFFQKTNRWLGAVLIGAGLLGLWGWMQASDPDCLLDTDVPLQLRLCAPEIVGDAPLQPLWMLLLPGLALLCGGYCLTRSGNPRPDHNAPQ
jgi:hypothetical protein